MYRVRRNVVFWKKDKSGRPSPREELTAEIERLSAGQVLRFRLPEIYGGGFGVIEINPGYPGKGGRYLMNTETAVNGLQSGKKSNLFDTNKAGVLASWMLDRNGERYNWSESRYARRRQGTECPQPL